MFLATPGLADAVTGGVAAHDVEEEEAEGPHPVLDVVGLDPSSPDPLIGASGAIAGVLGAYLVLYPRARVRVLLPFLVFLPLRLPAWLVLGFWFALQAVYSSGYGVSGAGTVAYAAHVAGFVAGMLPAWPLKPGTPPPPEPPGLLFGRRARPRATW